MIDTPDLSEETSNISDNEIATAIDLARKPLKETNVLRTYDIQDSIKISIDENQRIVFPESINLAKMSFDPYKLLIGISAGDYDESQNKAIIFYPHERNNKLNGKSVMRMSVNAAVKLLETCSEYLGIDSKRLFYIFEDYTNRTRIWNDEEMELHGNGLVYTLLNHYSNKVRGSTVK
ncbi:hypothetical protein A3F00_01640 [Candidatus Daviesbacteria bacterium RIFCSPHIGHO2_12_FULL_37_11]|uniref:Uncharacterized protein n=1 Tax=Candidatus Daviesbacteria bacterium RIFCSPHIGHO2_12_FULL_37_11 TaxID=1797777 RepID=A0A1F5KCS5_9BACT|nr:MAG: hypothetical protein A2111_01495 [Candidatus Daviesbacteria bacterium GWA1_38_6]OGE16480.1 MAG: hypothetical protein A2769_02285 [Candidatus Daviesbacteria bacterium RIFCSPHIGHO2_01_FULL_37_27]OGE38575.1 MAG: hypothetical protein A3F00_01640 [Candidatus Daviesbacteria bacterium RIFCSPHIGHO2_12_FULL_37_11]OGE46286.1 MAG: hypothetical protein A3B39_03865 [Candidatus Daviesbacteria bacterium RIFCSPLOWO2_01_FULL_37_10]